jgi:plasmid stabilization system protein ParE
MGRQRSCGFQQAIDYLHQQSPGAAGRIGQRILDVVSLLEEFPELAPPSRHRGLRQLTVARTPYLVIYRIEADRVEIRAVVHSRQRRRR